MEYLLYIASALLGFLFRYQLGLTNACKTLGVRISDGASETGFQDAITPPSSTNITLLVWGLILGLFAFSIFGFGWGEFGIAAGVFFVVSIVLGAIVIPKPDSPHFVRRIYRSMINRWADYEKEGDSVRADALKILIGKVEHACADKLA